MRSPTSYFDLRVQLSQWRSWWIAECAVHRGVFLEDFLEWRLRIYQALYRLSHYPLPFYVVIQHGKPIKIANPDENRVREQLHDDPTGEDAAERFKIQSQQQEIARKLEGVDDKLSRLNHVGQEVSSELEAIRAGQVERISRGEMEGPRTRKRRNKARRRPRWPIPWFLLGAYLVFDLLILCEAYQFALPILDLMGIDTSNLPREWKSNPLGVLNGAAFALAASAGLFFLWHLLISAGQTLSRSWDSAGPLVLARRLAGIVLLSCGLLLGTILMANLRHGTAVESKDFHAVQHDQATGTGMGTGVFVFLTLLVPCTAAALHLAIGQSAYWQNRRDVAAQRAQFDREEDARLVPAERVADSLALLQHQRDEIEQERTRLQTERLALADHALAVEQQRLDRLQHARWCTLVYAQTLLAALETDRHCFIKAVNRSKKFHLLPDAPRVHQHEPPPPGQFVHPLLTAARNGHRV